MLLTPRRRTVTVPPLTSYISFLSPSTWLKMDETVGSTLVDSVGGKNFTIAGTTTIGNASGLSRDPLSVNTDGSTSRASYAGNIGRAGTTYAFLINMLTGGATPGFPTLFSSTVGANLTYIGFGNYTGLGQIDCYWQTSAGVIGSTSSSYITYNQWQWLFVQYRTSPARIDLFTGINGSATERAYAQHQTNAGTDLTATASYLFTFNSPVPSFTWYGKIAEFAVFSSLLSTEQMTKLTKFAGV